MADIVEQIARIIAPEAFEPCEAGEVCPFCQGSQEAARAKARQIIEILHEHISEGGANEHALASKPPPSRSRTMMRRA